MIELRHAPLGNYLFRYCIGRIIAMHTGLMLKCGDTCCGTYSDKIPITAFPGIQDIPGINGMDKKKLIWSGHFIPLDEQIADQTPRYIFLCGFYQRYEYYFPYADQIRQWLRLETPYSDTPGDDLVLNFRQASDFPSHSLVPRAFYEQVISLNPGRRILIVTDVINQFVEEIAKDHQAEILPTPNCLLHISFLLKAKHLAIPVSTFSWWAAFLSEAQVYVPKMERGYWNRLSNPNAKPVTDSGEWCDFYVPEKRYIYLAC